MEKGQKAIFQLDNYKIVEFNYVIPKNESVDLEIEFKLGGKFFKSTNNYELTFETSIKTESDSQFLNIVTIADFVFDSSVGSEIPPYFYANSIAIVFPYVRAFINTLTSIANIKPLRLPLMNLVALGDTLKEETKLVD